MKDVQDRVVQFSNRYKLTDAGTGTELGTYDFEEVTGTVQQAGTPIDKELFDSIKEDIDECVRYTAQTLTDEQKEQARTNIDALGEEDIKINLNGSSVSNPSFYAPTTSGTAGQVLKSMGAGQAPVWADEPADISNAIVTLGASLTYNGSAQTQTVQSVVLNGDTLSPNVDYKISGNVATNAGNYTLMITGIGSYSGTAYVNWSISPAQGEISVSQSNVTLEGPTASAEVTVGITVGSGELSASTDDTDKISINLVGNTLTITNKSSSGSASVTVSLVGNYSATKTISVTTELANITLNDNSWETIKSIADQDLGANYWAVGDTKSITINGTVGTKAYNNVTLWAYILGFNHNPDREGEHLIHFGGFKTAQTGGVDICLVDIHYDSPSTGGEKWFNMNHSSNTNSGGWRGCDMRYDILGSTDTNNGEPTNTCATDPVSGTLMAAFPADLRAVLRPATKYTDNTGGGSNTASYVTATQDYMPLLAEFEVQGKRRRANSVEQNYQTQYAYYANGNSKVKYKQTSTGSAAVWWCRSPSVTNGVDFCYVGSGGGAVNDYAHYSRGVSPAFFI